MDDLQKYGEAFTWLAFMELHGLAIAFCMIFAAVGAVIFAPLFK